MGSIGLRLILPACILSPELHEKLCQGSCGNGIGKLRPHIVIAGKLLSLFLCLPCHDFQINKKWLQDMLIGTNRVGISNADCLSLYALSHTVRDDAVLGKIPSSDYISGSCGGNARKKFFSFSIGGILGKEGFLIAVGNQLRAGLGVGIGVMPIQLLFLCKGVSFLIRILVNLVRSNIQHGTNRRTMPYRLQKIYCPHHIGLVGFSGEKVGFPYQGLCRQVENQFRLRLLHCLS